MFFSKEPRSSMLMVSHAGQLHSRLPCLGAGMPRLSARLYSRRQYEPGCLDLRAPAASNSAQWPSHLIMLSGPRNVLSSDGRQLVRRLDDAQQVIYDGLESEGRTPHRWDAPPFSPEVRLAKGPLFLDRHDEQVRYAGSALGVNFSQQAVMQWISDASSGVSQAKATQLLKIMAHRDFNNKQVGFTSVAQYNSVIADNLPDLTGAYVCDIAIEGNMGAPVALTLRGGAAAKLYYHNLWEQLLLMFRDPDFREHTSLFPRPQYVDAKDPTSPRVFDGFMSGLLCQALYREAPTGAGLLFGQLYSDESSLHGKDNAYPFYGEGCCFCEGTHSVRGICYLLQPHSDCFVCSVIWQPRVSTGTSQCVSKLARGSALHSCSRGSTWPTTCTGLSCRASPMQRSSVASSTL
jgi:hypothetical protein